MSIVLNESAENTARSTGLVRRVRAMSGAQFVQTLVVAWLDHPEATADDLAATAETLGVAITPKAAAPGSATSRPPVCSRCCRPRWPTRKPMTNSRSAHDPLTIGWYTEGIRIRTLHVRSGLGADALLRMR
jgi:hypothetical protein